MSAVPIERKKLPTIAVGNSVGRGAVGEMTLGGKMVPLKGLPVEDSETPEAVN
jgi:hypothetical protein